MTIVIQRCAACGARNYPRRELCRTCLADALRDAEDDGQGLLLAATLIHRSLEGDYRLPLRIGTVLLDSGPHLLAFVADGIETDERVQVAAGCNALGEGAWFAERLNPIPTSDG